MTINERIEKAEAIKAAATKINATAGKAIKVWSKGDNVRLYTDGNGYTSIEADGSINYVKRQGWGHIITEAIETL